MSQKLRFKTEKSRDDGRHAWFYQLQGKLVGYRECYDFMEDAREQVTSETPHVVLLMSGVTLINSTGIGIIAALLTSSGNKNGKLFLVAPSDSALRQLKATHLMDYLTVVDDLGDLPD